MSDLDKLIEASEGGGEITSVNWSVFDWSDDSRVNCTNVIKASSGSLDAAKALHDALLPGWRKDLNFMEFPDGSGAVTMFGPMPENAGKWEFAPKFEAQGANLARAWLIAILKAYRSQQEVKA